MFYTKCKVKGGLQGQVILPEANPPWVVKLKTLSFVAASDHFIQDKLSLPTNYEAIKLPYPDDRFGDRPDPSFHHFIPPQEPYDHLIVYRKKSP